MYSAELCGGVERVLVAVPTQYSVLSRSLRWGRAGTGRSTDSVLCTQQIFAVG